MNPTQTLLSHIPEQLSSMVCTHARVYVGIMEKEDEGMYQIGWAMYLFENAEQTEPEEQEPLHVVKDLSLSPDELNAMLDAFQELPSIFGDDDISCHYKLILSH
ncbi:hypothetical protein [Parendozoicomonas haliclonae]|uniref:Uncharacterized protein n=1 Tax=Parendozoicomonas haliclonae TaxID=1960125 RepID=A0A1X7AQW8_9GAMM|nr:hypothetical protein [Parendozoicomonas haliclonae]SMA50488.1 hypothetical protein EHSB41UT_04299 [Parendozoicomonas haliclonae]